MEKVMKMRMLFTLIAGACASASLLAQTETPAHQHDHNAMMAAPAGAAMSHEGHSMQMVEMKRSEAMYKVPALSFARQDGKKRGFPAELDDGRPVLLQFMYTSCTTVCPVTTQTFLQVQEKLGNDSRKLHMVSISIDPEYDTPQRLDTFAKKLGAGPQWQFFGGTLSASVAMQKAFDAFRGDKMNHFPVSYLRAAPGKPWVRLEGLYSPDEIIKEYKALAK